MKELNDMSVLIKTAILAGLLMMAASGFVLNGCEDITPEETPAEKTAVPSADFPKIASWLAKKDQLLTGGRPYDLVMTGWVTPEEAAGLKANNSRVKIYAGLSCNWVYAGEEWLKFLTTVASYGRGAPFEIKDSMYLRGKGGGKCAFGWASEEWGHAEIYAMDPRNAEWVELIVSFYKNVLEQPQHDGIIVDMVTEKSWCPETISDKEWVAATKAIFAGIRDINKDNKPVIFNSGRDLSEIDEYGEFMDGYLMENFLGGQFGASFQEGLAAAESDYIVIYAVDTDDTGIRDEARMRMGLTLSLLNDNTYFTYDIGGRDHGDAWWFNEYEVDLGRLVEAKYKEGGGYRRDFEKGTVICAPDKDVDVVFSEEYTDVSTGQRGKAFTIKQGDGRIYLR